MKKIQENRRRRCDDVSQVNSIAFRLFGIPVYWYAIIIVSGIALAVWLSSREAVRVGLKEDDVFDFMLWDYLQQLLARACTRRFSMARLCRQSD